MKDFKRHYSGNLSKNFWQRINRNGSNTAYNLACALQDIEKVMLTRIEIAMLNHKLGIGQEDGK